MQLFKSKKKRIKELEKELNEADLALDKLNGAIEDVLFYQGHDAYVCRLTEHVAESSVPIERPAEIRRKDCNRIECVIWSLLVLMYGGFDDDPVKGTILDKNAALEHLMRWRDVSIGNV